MSGEGSANEPSLVRLKRVRESLLRLHKVLLELQRKDWEQASGKTVNSYELLNLLMHDQAFAWLHYLSELIVQIDEQLAAEPESTEEELVRLLDQVKTLLTPAEPGTEFQENYFAALQLSPDAVLAHAEAVKGLR
jgi:hypothetical protein